MSYKETSSVSDFFPLDTLRLHLAESRRLLILSEDGATPAGNVSHARLGYGPRR